MSGRSWGCEEADDRRVEEIAGQLEETEQADLYSSVSADLGNNREHDDRRIEANVGGPLPSNIREYLDELTRSLALTPPIHPRVLKTLYDRKDYPAMLGWIKNSMSLKLRVGLRIVDRPETSPPMWIEMPDPIPAFGTAEFNETKVIVNARRDILETKPFPAVVAGFAHELSHVVLFSIGHRLQDDEKAVDLTAMILGYQYDICDAEFTETNGELSEKWRLGYLTSAEALAASRHIAKIRYGWKSKFKTAHRPSETGHRPSKDWQTERGIIAFFTVGAVILSVVVLPIFF